MGKTAHHTPHKYDEIPDRIWLNFRIQWSPPDSAIRQHAVYDLRYSALAMKTARSGVRPLPEKVRRQVRYWRNFHTRAEFLYRG